MGNILKKISKITKLQEKKVKGIVIKSILCWILLFIPILQVPSLLIASPLFIFLQIITSSDYMGFTFAYVYPKGIIIIILFWLYYVIFFYVLECLISSVRDNIKNAK